MCVLGIQDKDKIPEKLQLTCHPISFVTLYRARKGKWVNSRDEEMLAPPKGISSLYMASNEKTAIKEIRARYNDDITLAEIEINNNLYIWNFNFYEYEKLGVLLRRNLNLETQYLIEILNEELSLEEDKLISKTVLCNSDNKRKLAYIPFQFISEYVKSRGIDGFSYRNSLNQNG